MYNGPDHSSTNHDDWVLDPLNHIYLLLSLFSGSNFKHSCIVGKGIVITQKDLLKFLYIQSKKNVHLKNLFNQKVKDSVRRHLKVSGDQSTIKFLDFNMTIHESLKVLTASGFGALPIKYNGMYKQFTTRTLGYEVDNYMDLKSRNLSDLELSDLNMIDREKTVCEAIEIMLEEGYSRIWVEDPLDVLTMTDIITMVYNQDDCCQ